jgi:hypothetical protein
VYKYTSKILKNGEYLHKKAKNVYSVNLGAQAVPSEEKKLEAENLSLMSF